MNCVPRIFLDANVFKFSATQNLRFIPCNKKTYDDKGRVTGVQLYTLGHINPNERLSNPELRKEADLLPDVALAVKRSELEAVTQLEADVETWGLPNMDSESGRFYGAPIRRVQAPIKYSRILFGWGHFDSKQLRRDFLLHIRHPRFLELQRMTGAYQGKKPPNENQLLDAFHIWCAEYNECDFFLTLDLKLIRIVSEHPKRLSGLELVRPSELLERIRMRGL
jgi:hypothetical protein